MPDNLATKTTPEEKKRRKALNRQIRKEKQGNKSKGKKRISFRTDYAAKDWKSELESQRMQEIEAQEEEKIIPPETKIPRRNDQKEKEQKEKPKEEESTNESRLREARRYARKQIKDKAKKVVKKAAKKAAGQAAKAVGRSIWVYVIVPIAGFIAATWYIWLILVIIIIIIVIIKENPELIIKYIPESIYEILKLKIKGDL